jgi:electron transport complex protein RnfC
MPNTVRRFSGGVHPFDGEKPRTRGLAVETAPLPARVVLSLQQHIGAPAKAVVKKGDAVKRGQLVAESGGFVSVGVHSSISGTVAEIGSCRHVLGMDVPAVIVESDGQDTPAAGVGTPVANADKLTAAEITNRIRDAGICGLGGAGFPTHVKLSPPADKPIDTLVINGAECEPALSADHRIMLERAEDVLRGVAYLRRALERNGALPKTFVAVEENKPDAIAALTRARSQAGVECEIVPLHVLYPQGAEKPLIYALTGRAVPPQSQRGLPMDVGVVVQNAGTALAVHEAIDRGTPLVQRVLTIAGDAVGKPANVLVRLGTPVPELLKDRDVAPDAGRIIFGGPMMGIAQYTDDLPVTKTTSGILVERTREDGLFGPCIRCGRCVEVCPMQLVPTRLSTYAEASMYDKMVAWNVIDCIECGCCAYSCPARRPIVHQVKLGKWALAQAQKKAKAAGGGK